VNTMKTKVKPKVKITLNFLDSSNGRINEYSEDQSQAQRIRLTIILLLSSQ
jgi:hypothetical protein